MAGGPDPGLALVAQLRRGAPDAIATLVRRVPVFADAIRGHGPFALYQHWGVSRPGPQPLRSVVELASYLARETPTRLRLLHADRNEFQLLVMAAIDGGMLDKAKTRKLLGLTGDRAGQARLDRAAAGLAELLLSDPDRGWVALTPGIVGYVPLPGIPFRAGAESLTKDELAPVAKRLGVRISGARKFELVDAIEAALRDHATVASLVAALDPAARKLLDSLTGRGAVPFDSIGVHYYRRPTRWDSPRALPPGAAALQQLVESGLVGVAEYDRRCWTWLDAEIAARGGRLYDDWSVPTPSQSPIGAPATITLPPLPAVLDAVVEAFATTPIKALKTGGLGVQSVRAIAKSQRRAPAEVGIVASIAVELGLIGLVVLGEHGRGRNRTFEHGWQPDTERLEPWRSLPAWARSTRIVQQWIDSTQLPTDGSVIERFEPRARSSIAVYARRRLVELLAALPDGTGTTLDDLIAWCNFSHPHWFSTEIVAQLVAEARVLGVVPAEGPIGLTATARLMLFDSPALADALADSPTAFTVQADHTVIAPPGLDADLDARLARMSVLESDAGARIYRITDASIGGALDSGLDADAILAFLHEYSTVAITANVERTIRDAAQRHGQLRIGSAVTWIACDDPVQLMRAVAVKSARLTAVSTNAAISPLAEDKVLTALRAKGVAPARADSANEPKARLRRHFDASNLGPRPALLADLGDIDGLAKQLSEAPDNLELTREPTPEEMRAMMMARLAAGRRHRDSGSAGVLDDSDGEVDWDDLGEFDDDGFDDDWDA